MSSALLVHLSHSQITTFTSCPRRWHYEKVEHAPRERVAAALAFGVSVHDALAAVNEAAMDGATADGRAVFARRWRDFVDDTAVPIQFGRADSDGLLQKGLALVDLYKPPTGIVGVEQSFEVTLHPELPPIVGRIDLIRRDDNGDLVIADIKTSSTKALGDLTGIASQVALYREAYPDSNCEAIVLGKLVTPVITVQPIDPWPRDRLVSHYRGVHHAMRSGVRYAIRDWQCESCPFRDRCSRDD